MKNQVIILALILFALSSCAPKHEISATCPGRKQPPAVSEAQAMQAAKEFSHEQGYHWGEPTEVIAQNEKYWIFFKTPSTERRILGQRVLVVDQKGEVEPLPRR